MEGTKTVENRPPGSNRPAFDAVTHVDIDTFKGEWMIIVVSRVWSWPSKLMADALNDFRKYYNPGEAEREFDVFTQRHANRWPLLTMRCRRVPRSDLTS